jgi:D-amino-acid dehydrogenase
VLAAASESPRLAAPLGLKLPIYPVKGYSVTLSTAAANRSLGLPLVDFEQKVVITPLGRRLRIAGTAEFNGYDLALNPERGAHLLAQALALVPELGGNLEHVQVQHWAGLRPMTADGPPILGATPYHNLYCNTGHGPLGWTLAAGSSRLVADVIAGREPEIGLTGLDLRRFARR